jgi:2,3-bisphosphoglycerate-independent phosphoglycerate mutase
MPGRKVILIIMDGWGLGKLKGSDAIQNANVPFVSSLYNLYPNTTLITCGEDVGLPEGQMGNSEVGHLNLGAGRVVYQELQRINVAIREGMLAQNQQLLASIYYAIENKKPLHLMGLVSDGGVHSHINHLKAFLDICKEKGLHDVYVHALLMEGTVIQKVALVLLQSYRSIWMAPLAKLLLSVAVITQWTEIIAGSV